MKTELHTYPGYAEVVHYGNGRDKPPTSRSGELTKQEADELCKTIASTGATITLIPHE